MPIVSVVVCTRDRSKMMVRAVESLIAQTAPAEQFEIVVVDNGSKDDTREQVEALARKHPSYVVRYVLEQRPGIAHARNAGTEAAQGEYVASIDDDAAAEPDWVARIVGHIGNKPYVALGGRILPLYEAPKPAWFLDSYEERSWGDVQRFMVKGESFAASNMVVKKSALEAVGGFPTDVGMSGDRLMVGEEPMAFARLWEQVECRNLILYEPEMRVRHSVPAHKLRLLTGAKRDFAAGQFTARVMRQSGRPLSALFLRAMASVFVNLFVGLFTVFRTRNFQRWIYEGSREVAQPLGRMLALVGIEPKVRRL